MCRIADAIFVHSWTIYLNITTKHARRLTLKKINTDLLTTAATEDAQMDIDDQPTLLDSHAIDDLINKKTSQQNKPLKGDISWIKKQLESLKLKNNARGSGASHKKQNAQGQLNPKQKWAGPKAAIAANDSNTTSGNNKKTTSKN
jgi:hypothetical protein